MDYVNVSVCSSECATVCDVQFACMYGGIRISFVRILRYTSKYFYFALFIRICVLFNSLALWRFQQTNQTVDNDYITAYTHTATATLTQSHQYYFSQHFLSSSPFNWHLLLHGHTHIHLLRPIARYTSLSILYIWAFICACFAVHKFFKCSVAKIIEYIVIGLNFLYKLKLPRKEKNCSMLSSIIVISVAHFVVIIHFQSMNRIMKKKSNMKTDFNYYFLQSAGGQLHSLRSREKFETKTIFRKRYNRKLPFWMNIREKRPLLLFQWNFDLWTSETRVLIYAQTHDFAYIIFSRSLSLSHRVHVHVFMLLSLYSCLCI